MAGVHICAEALADIEWVASIGSTIVRVHQHAATLPRLTGAPASRRSDSHGQVGKTAHPSGPHSGRQGLSSRVNRTWPVGRGIKGTIPESRSRQRTGRETILLAGARKGSAVRPGRGAMSSSEDSLDSRTGWPHHEIGQDPHAITWLPLIGRGPMIAPQTQKCPAGKSQPGICLTPRR